MAIRLIFVVFVVCFGLAVAIIPSLFSQVLGLPNDLQALMSAAWEKSRAKKNLVCFAFVTLNSEHSCSCDVRHTRVPEPLSVQDMV